MGFGIGRRRMKYYLAISYKDGSDEIDKQIDISEMITKEKYDDFCNGKMRIDEMKRFENIALDYISFVWDIEEETK